MSLPEQFLADLAALTPSQLRAATTYVRALRGFPSANDEEDEANIRIAPAMLLSIDAENLRIAECDRAFSDAVQATPRGELFVDLIDPEYRDTALHALDIVRSGHKDTRNVRLRILRPHGDSLPVIMAAHFVEASQTPALIDVVCQDISHLKRIGTLEVFSEMLSIGIVLVDDEGRIALANSFAERMFSYEQGELVDKPVELLFGDNVLVMPKAASNDARHERSNRNVDYEISGRTKDGSPLELKIGWSAIRLGGHRFGVASIVDITAHKSIEDALRQHEEQRALIFSEGLLGDFTWDIESDTVEAHPTVFKLYGSPPIPGPVPGAWFRARQHPDDAAMVETTWRGQVSAGRDLAVEFRVLDDDGATRWIDCRGVLVRDIEGRPFRVQGLNIDITARKLAEAGHRESQARALKAEELLRTALQYANTVVWRWNFADDVTEWSGAVDELFGCDAEKLNGLDAFQQVVLPQDLPSLKESLNLSIAAGGDFNHEFRIVRPDGEIRWIAGRAGILRDAQARPYGMTGVNFDITKRKIAEKELQQSERDFRELANVIPQITFTANASGSIEHANRRFYEITGFSRKTNVDSKWPQIIAEEDRVRALQTWQGGIAIGRPFEWECRIWDETHRQNRWYLTRSVPVRNAEGAIVRWIATATDIHDQKTAEGRLEAEVQSRTRDLKESLLLLRQREEQLEKSLNEKDALLREIHHRVKNNLQIVSSLLAMQAANAPGSAAVAPLRDSERRISSMAMIHEQLYGTEDMQTVEFGEHARRLAETLFASMAETPLFACSLELDAVNLTIHQAIPCALILNELLTNALKYAYPNQPGGEITVRLSASADLVELTVSDRGAGLPPHIDPYSPTTLGLEIVNVLVKQLNGDLNVNSSDGTSFTVKFEPQENTQKVTRLRSRSISGGIAS